MKALRQDHSFVYPDKGKPILHNALCRDYLCSSCGGKPVTRWYDDVGWETRCAACGGTEFITVRAAMRKEHERRTEEVQAAEVFRHLPADVQRMIERRE